MLHHVAPENCVWMNWAFQDHPTRVIVHDATLSLFPHASLSLIRCHYRAQWATAVTIAANRALCPPSLQWWNADRFSPHSHHKNRPPHIPPSWTGLIWTWTKKWAKSANLPASPDQLNLLQCCQCCSLLSIRHSTPDPEVIPCPLSVPEIVRASCLWVEHGENKTGGVMVRCWGPTLMKGRNSSRDVSLTGVQRTIFAPLQLWSTNCHGLIITCVACAPL